MRYVLKPLSKVTEHHDFTRMGKREKGEKSSPRPNNIFMTKHSFGVVKTTIKFRSKALRQRKNLLLMLTY